jgi:hypothetical protein
MHLTLPDYITLVVDAYKKKRHNNELSPLLVTFKRRDIRQECVNLYNKKVKDGERNEHSMLTAFFGEPMQGRSLIYTIENCSLDKFRPLENLVKKGVKNPNLTSVELLAWLIDFRHRPYSVGMNVLLNNDELETPGEEPEEAQAEQKEDGENLITLENSRAENHISVADKPGEPQKLSIDQTRIKRSTIVVLSFIISGVVLTAIYSVNKPQNESLNPLGNSTTKCMVWSDDHYEELPCNEERKGQLKLVLDQEKIKSFKRILREDTITEKSIGKIYYIRRNNLIEYYTSGGNHPVEMTKQLHPLTRYMFDKHLSKNDTAKKN